MYNLSRYVIDEDFEKFEQKVNNNLQDLVNRTKSYISKVYINGQSGYIKLADNTIIQWGTNAYPGGSYTQFTVGLVTPFSSTNYTPVLTARGSDNINASAMKLISITNNSFNVKYTGAGNNSGTINGITWIAIGN